jgi:hypothetical protein
VTQRFKTLRAVLATAVFATGAAGIATAGASGCDPMYPCYTDASTPAAVYDLATRTDHAPCESYPCYPEQAKAATPIAAEAAVTERTFDPRS